MPGFYINKGVSYRMSEFGHQAAALKNKHKGYSVSTHNDLFKKAPPVDNVQVYDKPRQAYATISKATAVSVYSSTQFSKPAPIDTVLHEVGDKVIQKRAALSKEYGLLSLLTTLGAAGLGYLSLLILSFSFFDILLIIGFSAFLIMSILLMIDCFKNAHFVRHSKWAHLDDKRKATFGMIMGIISLIVMVAFGGLLLMVLSM